MESYIQSVDSKYKLAICELYHPHFHGNINPRENGEIMRKYIYTSFLPTYYIEHDQQFDDDLYPLDGSGPWGIHNHRFIQQINHPYIRNYTNVTKTHALEIVQCINIINSQIVCVLKTFWLKIFQRKYKKYYKNLQIQIKRGKNPKVLFYRQLTGNKF